MIADFELQRERIPRSPSGRWTSTPTVDLFGGLLAHTGSANLGGILPGIFGGDLWAQCFMHRRQTIFQFALGGTIVLAEANEHVNLINEENADRTVHVGMPGSQVMPSVILVDANINHTESLWAQIDVHFDFYVKGAGATVWTDPEILVRTFQWPLAPI